MTPEDYLFYKNLYNVLNEPNIGDLIAKYAKTQYDIALEKLKNNRDLHEIGYLQGQIKAFEALLNLKKTAFDILKGAK